MERLLGKIKRNYLNWKWRKKSRQEIFTDIYNNRRWGNSESVSGGGSMVSSSQMIRTYLPFIIELFQIKTITDLACGDFNWLKHVPLHSADYLGLDIVEDLIIKNNDEYGNDAISFKLSDAIEDNIRKSDLLICRDLMVHQKEEDNQRLISNIKASNSKYLLATTFREQLKNEACLTGNWKAINLQSHPYNLPNPLILLNEMPYSSFEETPVKYIGLWEISGL